MRRKERSKQNFSGLYYPNPELSSTVEIKLMDMSVLDCIIKYPISKGILNIHFNLKNYI